MNQPAPAPPASDSCANCGATLQGKYCHACGQPIKGMIRPLSGLTADVIDSVFNIDSRILRTIGPLYFRPGFLTTEYFIGRRQRYVTPFRLVFFLTIIAFLLAQLYSDQTGLSNSPLFKMGTNSIAAATTQETVFHFRDEALKEIEEATRKSGLPPEARKALEEARAEILRQSQARMEYLKKVQEARAKGLPPPAPQSADEGNPVPDSAHWRKRKESKESPAGEPAPAEENKPAAETPAGGAPSEAPAAPAIEIPGATVPPIQLPPIPEVRDKDGKVVPTPPVPQLPGTDGEKEPEITFSGGKPWDPKTNPLTFDFLPEAGNAKVNELIGTMRHNLKRISTEPKRMMAAYFGVLPQTLFVLMPLFAVMLKFFYIFKRRYYMEHLIVALHSHAFLSLSVLLISLLGLARLAFPAATTPLTWLMMAAGWWMPLYLLLMQKRVYRQNWFMTLLKFSIIGTCYTVLVSVALAIAAVIALAVA
ncbi:DUF3667 domain-containing protein [Tahibacter harae]|uniref:DUF3667 domain-containing protein n=1 Tax=Tahibacter harae TaxID=2963937 RepID=A0ABT1QP66_9GAMM|nr:DUF3667 domain-containing protein [Tahibacter harae]MCQ4164027.1 DUF3667 domain-containing protein [Tahibacter harae]